jgi:predicted unusual protein kinase regulating ubiquinone biosynthesis (AarF/ABC1/UbiB family)
LLADEPVYLLPQLHPDLTTHSVLAMSFVGGVPIESLVDAPQTERDRAVALLFALLLREVFEFRLVQTDPNFANYRYDTDSRQLILLDFGATRPYKATMANEFRRLMKGAITGDRSTMSAAAMAIGYFDATTQEKHQQAILDMGAQAFEPFCHAGEYDFGTSDLPSRIRNGGMALGLDKTFWQLPPADAMLLQRKFGGLYLLAIRLKARVDLHAMAQAALPSRKRSPQFPA